MNYSQAVEASKQDGYISIRYSSQSLILSVLELSDHSILVCEPFDNWKTKQYSIQEFNRLFVNLFDEQCWEVNGSQYCVFMLARTNLQLASYTNYVETMKESIACHFMPIVCADLPGKNNKVFILKSADNGYYLLHGTSEDQTYQYFADSDLMDMYLLDYTFISPYHTALYDICFDIENSKHAGFKVPSKQEVSNMLAHVDTSKPAIKVPDSWQLLRYESINNEEYKIAVSLPVQSHITTIENSGALTHLYFCLRRWRSYYSKF